MFEAVRGAERLPGTLLRRGTMMRQDTMMRTGAGQGQATDGPALPGRPRRIQTAATGPCAPEGRSDCA